MRLPTVPSKYLAEHLSSVYFKSVWNSTPDSGRVNFRLKKTVERIQTGAVPINLSVVGLPTTDTAYSVYSSGYRGFEFILNRDNLGWVSDTEILDKLGFTIRAYTAAGRHLPMGSVYLRFLVAENLVVVAISSKTMKKCAGSSYPDIYLTTIKDTTRVSPVTFTTKTVSTLLNSSTTPGAVVSLIAQKRQACPNGTMVFVNGWIHDLDHLPTLVNGDVVCITQDPDIIGSVDVQIDGNDNGYYSERYGEYRELLHVTKVKNPNNYLLTTDNLTFCLFDRDTHRGVYGHRANPHAIESVTHSDFSIPHTTVQAAVNDLSAGGVYVRLYLRLPAAPNRLIDEANHIIDLYSLSDSEILKQLTGTADLQIPEWKAENLEKSPFLNLMYLYTGLNAPEMLGHFIDAMGYYEIASAIGQQMRKYTYAGATVFIMKPVRLFNIACNAIVYANGKKIPEDQIVIQDHSYDRFSLSFKATSGVQNGDMIHVYILEGGGRAAVSYNPISITKSITLPNEDYELYQITTFGQPKPVWGSAVMEGYKKVPLGPADYTVTALPDGNYKYEVRSSNYGKRYALLPRTGMISAAYDISEKVSNGESIVIDLLTPFEDMGFMPIMEYETMEVYLNGYRLVDQIDYDCRYELDVDGNILQNLLTISNALYLDLEGGLNQVEVLVHGDTVISEDSGFSVDNKLIRTSTPSLWSRASGRAFVSGKLINGVTEVGNVLIPTTPVAEGGLFLTEFNMAYGTQKLLTGFSPNETRNLRGRIDHLLGITPPEVPDVVLVEELHALFSPFLSTIVTDVGNELLTVIDDPDNVKFLKQFSAYKDILDRDPVVGYSDKVDKRFVTIAAHYTNYGVNDPEQMVRTQRLVNLVLSPSGLSIKEVLV